MISFKAILGVIIVAVLIGVLYVSFEKNFFSKGAVSNAKTSSAQELPKDNLQTQTSVITLPTPETTPAPIDGSSNLLNEASNLEMRDYSTLFEDLKDKVAE